MTGFVFLDKEEGITSFIGAAKMRRIFSEKKAGHTGTLDPMATGVLPIAIGHATRFIELIPSHDKAYRARFILGKTTDTLDITGKVTGEYDVTSTKEDVAKKVFSVIAPSYAGLNGGYTQVLKMGPRRGDGAEMAIIKLVD